jgi:hypothetical protein
MSSGFLGNQVHGLIESVPSPSSLLLLSVLSRQHLFVASRKSAPNFLDLLTA